MHQPEHDLRPFQASAASPRRYISFGLVAALHVVVIYALASGLAASVIAKLPTELKAEVVQQKPPEQEKTPPPPPPDLAKPPPPFVPPPDISIQTNAPAGNAISNVQSKRVVPVVRTIPPRPVGRRHDCTSGYPPISRRLGEQGKVMIQFVVNADGSVSNVKVDRSSGYSRLDNAATMCVGYWRYKPAMQGGKPIAVTTKALVTYQLR